jgi:DNA-binding MarR family transcriptional regulator
MDHAQIEQVRRFNRLVTRRAGVLDDDYLSRGRPLGEARVVFETGADGIDVGALRARLGLDSGYLSRLISSLKTQGLVAVQTSANDARMRRVVLTPKGHAERAAYDRLADKLAASTLNPLDPADRDRLVAAMGEVERLLKAALVEVSIEPADSGDARNCLAAYFRELAARFEGGFDPADPGLTQVDDLAPPSGLFVVARLDGEAVGCGGLKRVNDATGEIKRVWTAPSARRMGVARRLLHKLEALARQEGLKTLRLDTNRALTEAHRLYRSEGYREIGRFNDNPFSHHWFEKRL